MKNMQIWHKGNEVTLTGKVETHYGGVFAVAETADKKIIHIAVNRLNMLPLNQRLDFPHKLFVAIHQSGNAGKEA